MNSNINNLVSISEANQNFSKIVRMVDENGAAVILKNNKLRYVLAEHSQSEKVDMVEDVELGEVAKRILSKQYEGF